MDDDGEDDTERKANDNRHRCHRTTTSRSTTRTTRPIRHPQQYHQPPPQHSSSPIAAGRCANATENDDHDDDHDDTAAVVATAATTTTTKTAATTTTILPSSSSSSSLLQVRLRSIRSRGLAGLVGTTTTTTTHPRKKKNHQHHHDDDDDTVVAVTLTDEEDEDDTSTSTTNTKNMLLAITGETGTGKSLLFVKTIELLRGGCPAPALLVSSSFVSSSASTTTTTTTTTSTLSSSSSSSVSLQAKNSDNNSDNNNSTLASSSSTTASSSSPPLPASSSSSSSSSGAASAAFCEISLDLVATTNIVKTSTIVTSAGHHDQQQQQQQQHHQQLKDDDNDRLRLAQEWWTDVVVRSQLPPSPSPPPGANDEWVRATTTTMTTLPTTITLRRNFFLPCEKQSRKKKKNTTTTKTTTTRKTLSSSSSLWLDSECYINNHLVPVSVLQTVATSLLTVVDATRAAMMMEQSPTARMVLLDQSLSPFLFSTVQTTRTMYRSCRTLRETLETEVLSQYYHSADDNNLLRHFVDELDGFAQRATQFCRRCGGYSYQHFDDFDDDDVDVDQSDGNSVDDDDDDEEEHLSDINNNNNILLSKVEWTDNQWNNGGRPPEPPQQRRRQPPQKHPSSSSSSSQPPIFVSAMYEALCRLRTDLRALDERIVAIRGAINALSLLSATASAKTAVETARRFLLSSSSSSSRTGNAFLASDDTDTDENDHRSKYTESLEQSHELLNRLEKDIVDCTRFLEDDPAGLLQLSLIEQSKYGVTVDAIDGLLAEWGTLARKHGVLPTVLPMRHHALLNELDGSAEAAAERLPAALIAEKEALIAFEQACDALREARRVVAADIAQKVNQRLPSLGMESSKLRISVEKVHDCRDRVVYASNSNTALGCDAVDLLLERKESSSSSSLPGRSEPYRQRNGRQRRRGLVIGESASAGEKARLLLALECASPGAISAMTNETPTNKKINKDDDDDVTSSICRGSGIAAVTIFDEIDAHVGGRAAVAVANMLAEQSVHGQILAITHSPSVAAIADAHWVVRKHEKEEKNEQKCSINAGSATVSSATTTTTTTTAPLPASTTTTTVSIEQVVGEQRKQELARMTSGDVAPDEAIAFAEALMRDIMPKDRRQQQQQSSTMVG